ncbi:MAG: SpoIVB peptidase [Faecalibacterium sp.]
MKNAGGTRRPARRVRALCMAAVYLAVAAAAALGWLYAHLPDRVYLEPGQSLVLPRFAWIEPLGGHGSQNVSSSRAAGSYQATLALGGFLPVKTVRAIVTDRPSVKVCGTPFGVKMFSEGALIVGFSDINVLSGSANPAKAAGLRLGDRIICIGSLQTENNDAVKAALEASEGKPVEVVYVRGGEQFSTTLTPAWDTAMEQWRAGMWVRDSSAGVGTLTFVDEENGVFAGLGHPISDSDTGENVALRSGEIVPCEIAGCTPGTIGSPGELKGRFLSAHAMGTIRINGDNGVYGTTRGDFEGTVMEVAFAQEVAEGPAEIWTTVSGESACVYTVEIEKVSDADPVRNMVVHVTDPELLARTGGIVQGMSGSPIVQNGRLVGAVTHVLVNDPTRGYAIFAQTMLEQAQAAAQQADRAA